VGDRWAIPLENRFVLIKGLGEQWTVFCGKFKEKVRDIIFVCRMIRHPALLLEHRKIEPTIKIK
jgi:hypothetical protein